MTKKHYDWKLGTALPKIGPHSLAKHRILRRYIERYIEIVTATSWQEQLSITFVDGYAGGGRYASGRETIPSGPDRHAQVERSFFWISMAGAR
jgi:three-Cys-motif partner protein